LAGFSEIIVLAGFWLASAGFGSLRLVLDGLCWFALMIGFGWCWLAL